MSDITIISFSGRPDGNCAGVSAFILNYYKRTNIRSFVIQNMEQCGTCHYECLKLSETCPKLSAGYEELMDTIRRSKLVYFIVPNYCGFPCSSYFTFNERSVGYFNMDRQIMDQYMSVKKRFVIISNTESAEFESAMQQQTAEVPDILYLKTSKYGKQSITGDLMDSEAAKTDLLSFLHAMPSDINIIA